MSTQGGIKKQEKSPQEATNGGEIHAEPDGKKRPEKRIEEGGGAATKQSSECPHQREKSKCKECGGSSICPHQRRRSTCTECWDPIICPHQRIRSQCKECGGASLCPHQRIRSRCKESGVGSICPHQRRKSECNLKERGGAGLYPHQRIRSRCKKCGEGSKRTAPVVEAEEGGGKETATCQASSNHATRLVTCLVKLVT
jgi:hypothetical protein